MNRHGGKLVSSSWFVLHYLLYFSTPKCGRHGGLMVSVLISGSSSPGLSPDGGHFVVFLGKALDSHSVSLQPSVYKWLQANLMLGGNPAKD